MTKFFISDTHFSHNNIIKYENRPFTSVEEMNETMINNWNSKVKYNDEVYILGDFIFDNKENALDIIDKLNGRKYMIRGNHDRILKYEEVANKFEWIKDYFVLKYNKMKFVLFHYPIQVWDCQHHGSIHLYGHVHSNIGDHRMEYDIPNSYNVGVDVNKFTPISIDEILNKIKLNKESE